MSKQIEITDLDTEQVHLRVGHYNTASELAVAEADLPILEQKSIEAERHVQATRSANNFKALGKVANKRADALIKLQDGKDRYAKAEEAYLDNAIEIEEYYDTNQGAIQAQAEQEARSEGVNLHR